MGAFAITALILAMFLVASNAHIEGRTISDEVLNYHPKLDVSISFQTTPLRTDQPIPISITIVNNDLRKNLSSGASIVFSPSSLTKRAVLRIKEMILPGKELTKKLELPVVPSATYLDVPESIEFQLIDENGFVVPITTTGLNFRSDIVAKELIDWVPQQLVSHTWKWWMPAWLRDTVTVDPELINVCFFGIVGSGKSTTQNTLMSSLLTSDDVETMRPTGGGGDHVTLKIEGIDLTQSRRRMNIRMKFWDTFGLSVDNWPEHKFRDFLHGRLKNYTIFDQISGIAAPFTIDNNTPIADRVHVVMLFMPSEVFKNEILFNRMADSFRVAVSEGYNPLLMVTFANELSDQEKNALLEKIQTQFNIAKRQVFFVPFNGDSRKRDFETDREALFILDSIRASAEAFLDAHPPQPYGYGVWLATVALLLSGAVIMIGVPSVKPKKQVSVPASTSVSTPEPESEDSILTICHVQNSFKIRIDDDTQLKDIVSNVAQTFKLDENSIVFEDENGVQFQREAYAQDCGEKVYVKVLTSL